MASEKFSEFTDGGNLQSGDIVVGLRSASPLDNFKFTYPGGSSFTFTEVTGTSQNMAVNNGYIANNVALVTLTLPATSAVGDYIYIQGKGAGLYKIAQNAGQTIHVGATATTTGVLGSLSADAQYNSIMLLCITANNDWTSLTGPQGNFTAV